VSHAEREHRGLIRTVFFFRNVKRLNSLYKHDSSLLFATATDCFCEAYNEAVLLYICIHFYRGIREKSFEVPKSSAVKSA
jgi:hypothetical protein